MDIKAQIEKIVSKIKSDPSLLADFTSNPTETIEKLAGIDLPDGVADQIVAGIKEKLIGDKTDGILGAIKKLI